MLKKVLFHPLLHYYRSKFKQGYQKVFPRGYFLLLLGILMPLRAWSMKDHSENFLMEHIKDTHSWHFATLWGKHIEIPLPVILVSRDRGIECFSSARFYDPHHRLTPFRDYILIDQKVHCLTPHRSFVDLSITKNIAALLLSLLTLVGMLLWVVRKYTKNALTVPTGFLAFMDFIISFVKEEIAIPNIGQKYYEKFLPYLLTLFLFIWLNNLLGLLPGGANVTGNISVTLVLGILTTLITLLNGKKYYWHHKFQPEGVPKWLFPVMIPIEILGIFTKCFSLVVRLWANITAGHMLLLSIIGLIFSANSLYMGIGIGLGISLPFGVFMFLLKLLVAVLQAYVFTLLSAIYFGQAVQEE